LANFNQGDGTEIVAGLNEENVEAAVHGKLSNNKLKKIANPDPILTPHKKTNKILCNSTQ